MKFNNTKLILYFLKGSKKYFILSIIFVIISSTFDLINPKIIEFTVDSIIGNKDSFINNFISLNYLRTHFYIIAIIVILFALIGALFRYLYQLYNAKGAQTLIEKMRNVLFDHLLQLPFSWQVENSTGDIIQRCTSDVEQIKNFLSEQLTGLFRILILLTLSLTFMFRINVKLTLIAAAFIPIIVMYSLFFRKKISETFLEADEQEGKLSSITQENLTGVRVVRAFSKERLEKEKFEKQNHIYTNAYMKFSVYISMFWSAGDGISALQVMMIVLLGAIAVVNKEITSGNYLALVSYNAMLVWPIRQLGRVISDMSKASVSIDRIRYIMNSEIEKDKDHLKVDMSKDIVFNNVSFKYKEGENIIDNLSLTIKGGETLGILGHTGSGKSTLMYLLDKLYTPTSGQITIDNVDISLIDSHYLRNNIGFVLQEPYLFSKTIKENIVLGKDNLSNENLIQSSQIAALDHAIKKFKDGYETFVGERGVTLSGGQKQRVAIAQMIILNTPIMIFDDSLSAVDSETDKKIREAINNLPTNVTKIIISHRILSIKDADHIVVLNKGKIIEEGNHQSLINKNGIYKKINDIQGGSENE